MQIFIWKVIGSRNALPTGGQTGQQVETTYIIMTNE